MISWSNREQGSCPNCAMVYFNRSKPVECSNCGYHLGGSAAAKMPSPSLSVYTSQPLQPLQPHLSQSVSQCLYLATFATGATTSQ